MRLTQELQRLYRVPHPVSGTQGMLVDGANFVRALVLEIARPADWTALSAVWQGAQTDLELPAAAIAVSGTDGLQLWFSTAEPVPAHEAATFFDGLQRRYLPTTPSRRVQRYPRPATDAAAPWVHAQEVPVVQNNGNWSAFISADLPAVFADEPWLDLPPNPEQQADILSRLRSISPTQFRHALALMGTAPPPESTIQPRAPAPASMAEASAPQAFLLQVMQDPQIDMQHRIEAAKVLLAHGSGTKAA